MIPKSTIIVHIYILLTLYMYIKMVEIGNSKIDHSKVHIYIIYSYICMLDWSKLEIPKFPIQVHIYIFNSYIYVSLIGEKWKSKKIRFECACTRKLYM